MCVIAAAPAAGVSASMATAMNVSLALSAAATAASMVGQYQQQQAANDQAAYQAKVAENNAIAARYEGEYAKEQSAELAKQHRQRVNQFVGEQRAQQGASNIVVDEGSFLDITLDSVEMGKLDELAILHDGDMAEWRAEIMGANYDAQADVYSMSQSSPFLAPAITGLTGAGKGFQTYAMLQ